MKINLIFWAFVLLLMNAQGFAQGQDLSDRTMNLSSRAKTPAAARADLQEQAAKLITEELAKEALGNEGFQKNQQRIMSQVFKSWPRFIPLMRQGNLASEPDGRFTGSITMKISPELFRTVLQEQGVINQSQILPVVLPIVSFHDESARLSERWWLDGENSTSYLRTMSRAFEESLRPALRRQGFHSLKPFDARLSQNLPSSLRLERLSLEDLTSFGQFFQAPLILNGRTLVSKIDRTERYRIEVRLTVYQLGFQRELVDVVRSVETEIGKVELVAPRRWNSLLGEVADELAQQLHEALQRGQLGAQQIRLSILNSIKPRDIERLKEALRSPRIGIRQITEREISQQGVVYQIDIPLSAQELAQRLQNFDFNGRKYTAQAINNNEVRMVSQ